MIFALEDTAKREIFEETGIRTGMQYLHWFFPFHIVCDSYISVNVSINRQNLCSAIHNL